MADEIRPERGCDGSCGLVDRGPRFVAAGYGPPDENGAATDLLFHTDCVPGYIRRSHLDDPAIALRESGLKDEELAAAVIEAVEAANDEGLSNAEVFEGSEA